MYQLSVCIAHTHFQQKHYCKFQALIIQPRQTALITILTLAWNKLACAVRGFSYIQTQNVYPNQFSLLSDFSVLTWLFDDVLFLTKCTVYVYKQSQTVIQIVLLPEKQRQNKREGDWEVTQCRSPGRSSEACTLMWSLWKSAGPRGEGKRELDGCVFCGSLISSWIFTCPFFGTRGPFIRFSTSLLICCNTQFVNIPFKNMLKC